MSGGGAARFGDRCPPCPIARDCGLFVPMAAAHASLPVTPPSMRQWLSHI
jgi:hypothetical protein